MNTPPRLIRGTHDLLPAQYHAHRTVVTAAETETALAGFTRIDMPLMEETRLFDRGLGANSDIVGKEMYSFTTRGGEEVSLRPEGTASITRAYFSHGLAQSVPLRYFYAGPMFRYERPQKGRLRQFHQFGAELIGATGYLADLEIITLGMATLQRLGVADRVVLHLNTLGSSADRTAYRNALKEYFQQHREALSEESVRRLKSNPLRILDSKAEQDRALFVNAPIIDDFLATPSRERFTLLCAALDELGIVFTRDRNLVRGLDYYEHTTFEFITDALGTQGTVLGGGCYDRLFEIVGGKAATGVGFAAGIERLAELITPPALPAVQCALIPIGTTAEAATPALARYLREAGIATVFGFSGKVTARMRQADQMAARFCVIYGETEVAQHQVKLKDMCSGDEATMTTKAMRDALVRQLKIQQHG